MNATSTNRIAPKIDALHSRRAIATIAAAARIRKHVMPMAKNMPIGMALPAMNSAPPSSGPTSRADWNCAEFSAMAFSSKSFGTRSGSIDCHDGKASADMMPPRIPRPETHASDATGVRGDNCPALYSQPSAAACTSSTACVRMMSRLRSTRSASPPAHSARKSTGMPDRKLTTPRSSSELRNA